MAFADPEGSHAPATPHIRNQLVPEGNVVSSVCTTFSSSCSISSITSPGSSPSWRHRPKVSRSCPQRWAIASTMESNCLTSGDIAAFPRRAARNRSNGGTFRQSRSILSRCSRYSASCQIMVRRCHVRGRRCTTPLVESQPFFGRRKLAVQQCEKLTLCDTPTFNCDHCLTNRAGIPFHLPRPRH